MEQWKRIDFLPGYGGVIEVSDRGRMRVSNRRYRIRTKWGTVSEQTKPDQMIAGEVGNHGYRAVAFYVQRKRHRFLLHRLIAQAFVPGYDPQLTVNHINGDKLDNRATNLEWVSLEENTQKQWETGLLDLRGEKHPSAKLSDAQLREIIARLDAGGVVFRRLAAEYGVSDSLIYKIRKGRKRPASESFMPHPLRQVSFAP
ncbi:hypothetical protein DLM45_02245 [Hyphomicrobium methylovorum]|nr:hypothetical protein [Hyphomicrobium methylovorum]